MALARPSRPWRLLTLVVMLSAGKAVAQEQTDAISREFTVYAENLLSSVTADAVSREFTVYVGLQPLRVQTDAVSREFTVYVDAATAEGVTDAVSREFTTYVGLQPLRVQTDAVTREFTVFVDSAPPQPTDAVSREFTTYVGLQPLRSQTDAITREFTAFAATGCLGDLNDDLRIDMLDFGQLQRNFGITSGATSMDGDIDYDGAVLWPDAEYLILVLGGACP